MDPRQVRFLFQLMIDASTCTIGQQIKPLLFTQEIDDDEDGVGGR